MNKKYLYLFTLIIGLNVTMAPLQGMGRGKRAFTRFAAALRGGFSRLTSNSRVWVNRFNTAFPAHTRTQVFSRLGGLTAATLFLQQAEPPIMVQYPPTPVPKPKPIECTPRNIDAYPALKQKFIDLSVSQITTQNPVMVESIVHVIKKYPETMPQFRALTLKHGKQVHPTIQRAVTGVAMKVAVEGVAEKKSAMEKVTDLVTIENALQYGMPLVDIEALQQGDWQFIPTEKMPQVLASAALTDVTVYAAKNVAYDIFGDVIACPQFQNDDSWNVLNRGCRLGKFYFEHGVLRPWIRSNMIEPLVGK